MWTRIFVITFMLLYVVSATTAFLAAHDKKVNSKKSPQRTAWTAPSLKMTIQNDEDKNDISESSQANYLDDLTPPQINLKTESILFSPNPSTKSDNEVLDIWRTCKNRLPAVITGAWPWRPTQVADENPMGALYNILFVRVPVIGVGIGYIQHTLIQGHPLVMDMGQGPFEMSPLIVLSVLALVLA